MSYLPNASVSGFAIPVSLGGASGTLTLDFSAASQIYTATITGGTLISGRNYTAGASLALRLDVSGSNAVPLAFPALWANGWVTDVPTGIAAGRFGILTLTSVTTSNTGIIAGWAVRA